ncbi:MAG: sensor histidine kinase [Magnetococcales bacterium]|nr:sensor histidine kinase [Magnetococcales bacterium]
MNSIKVRLNLGLIISLLLLVGVLWFTTTGTIRDLTNSYIKDRLVLEIDTLLTELSLDNQDHPTIDQERVDRFFHHSFSGLYFQIIVSDGDETINLRSKSLKKSDLEVPKLKAGESVEYKTLGPRKEMLFILAKGFNVRDSTLTIAVADDLTFKRNSINSFQKTFFIIATIFIAAIILLQTLILKFSFKPIEQGRKNITSLRQGIIDKLDDDVPREIRPFVKKINRLLRKTNDYLGRSRNTISNLSHAIKTPLTLIAQLADREDIKENKEVCSTITNNTAILFSLIERQLKRARLTDPDILGSKFVLHDDISAIIKTLNTLYYDKKIEFVSAFPPDLEFDVDRQDFLELFGNLLDNAYKWADSKVVLCTGDEGKLWITIEDDGPGVPQEEITRIASRGVRLDETKIGSGLGLSICKDIVDQYGGTIILGRSSDLNGFSVHIEFPRPDENDEE